MIWWGELRGFFSRSPHDQLDPAVTVRWHGIPGGSDKSNVQFFHRIGVSVTSAKKRPRAVLRPYAVHVPAIRSKRYWHIDWRPSSVLWQAGGQSTAKPYQLTAIDGTSFILSDRAGNVTGGVHGR